MSEAPAEPVTPKTGYIYVVGAPCIQAVKIGHAANVADRVAGLQTGSPLPLIVLWQHRTLNPKSVEDTLHKRFRDKRVRGEWFDLGPDAVRIVRDAVRAVAPPPFTRRFASDAEGAEAVLSALRAADGAVTAQFLAARTNARYMDVRVILARLVKSGSVRPLGPRGMLFEITGAAGP